MKFYENYKRSLLKTFSYRLLIILSLGAVAWEVTGKYQEALKITVISNLLSTGLYFLHERVWSTTKWGKVNGLTVKRSR